LVRRSASAGEWRGSERGKRGGPGDGKRGREGDGKRGRKKVWENGKEKRGGKGRGKREGEGRGQGTGEGGRGSMVSPLVFSGGVSSTYSSWHKSTGRGSRTIAAKNHRSIQVAAVPFVLLD